MLLPVDLSIATESMARVGVRFRVRFRVRVRVRGRGVCRLVASVSVAK
jgi:hypothetical protein